MATNLLGGRAAGQEVRAGDWPLRAREAGAGRARSRAGSGGPEGGLLRPRWYRVRAQRTSRGLSPAAQPLCPALPYFVQPAAGL